MPSLDLLLGYWPGWLALVVAVILTFNKLAEESEKFARTFGRLGREIRRRSLERHHIDLKAAEFANAVQEAVNRAVADAREKWEEDENEALAALDARLKTVSEVTAVQKKDLDELRFQVRCLSAYTEYEALWHNRLSIKVSKTTHLRMEDLPYHIGYWEFEGEYRKNPNWREWAQQ